MPFIPIFQHKGSQMKFSFIPALSTNNQAPPSNNLLFYQAYEIVSLKVCTEIGNFISQNMTTKVLLLKNREMKECVEIDPR